MTDRMVKNKVSNLKTRKKVSWFTDLKPLDSAFSYHFKESKVPQKGTKLTTDALNAAMTAAVREAVAFTHEDQSHEVLSTGHADTAAAHCQAEVKTLREQLAAAQSESKTLREQLAHAARGATAAALAEVKPLREQLGAAQGARAGAKEANAKLRESMEKAPAENQRLHEQIDASHAAVADHVVKKRADAEEGRSRRK
eukprot:jgi/Tetstr1/425905/TSEL_016276.t1